MPTQFTSPMREGSLVLPPYAGLTGVRTPAETIQCVEIAKQAGFGPDGVQNAMFGILTSGLLVGRQELPFTTKLHRHAVSYQDLLGSLEVVQNNQMVAMVHFEIEREMARPAERHTADAKDVITLLSQLKRDGVLAAVQLNGTLTSDEVRRVAETTGSPIVIQLRRELLGIGERALFEYVETVYSQVSAFLIDSSVGTGERFDPAVSTGLHIDWAHRFGRDKLFGYAGGMGGDNPERLSHTETAIRAIRTVLAAHDLVFATDVETGDRRPTDQGDQLDLEFYRRDLLARRNGLTDVTIHPPVSR